MTELTLNDYQRRAGATNKGTRLFVNRAVEGDLEIIDGLYNALGMGGEAGEVMEKIKKHARDGVASLKTHREEVGKELGDVLWYLSQLAADFGFSLQEVAQMNLDKLASRKARGVLSGSGDNR